MIGKCLCGAVQFEISGQVPNLYQCHCSLCRKQGGSSANAATIVNERCFSWLSGKDRISHFKLDSGFTSDFCATCGSPVPNRLRDTDAYWIPAGLLEAEDGLQIVLHIYTGSKAAWDAIPASGKHFGEMPDFETMAREMQGDRD